MLENPLGFSDVNVHNLWLCTFMLDVMGSFLDGDLDDNEIGVFMTHNDAGEEIDVIEQWKTVSLDWWNLHKYNLNIRELCDI